MQIKPYAEYKQKYPTKAYLLNIPSLTNELMLLGQPKMVQTQ